MQLDMATYNFHNTLYNVLIDNASNIFLLNISYENRKL